MLLVLFGIATRLHLLASPVLEVDGDEAVLGIMAERLLAGERMPVFFLGQTYGFALIEVLLTAASFALFGVSAAAMKGAMLLLWLFGGGFLVAAARRLNGDRAALLAAILLVSCPAWGAWSLKARGGYLTAFACANGALWLALDRRTFSPRRELLQDAAMGVLSGLCMVSQALWLVPLAPFVLVHLQRRPRPVRSFLRVALWAFLVVCSVSVLGSASATGTFHPSIVNVELVQGFLALPMLAWHTVSGAFEMRQAVESTSFTLAAAVWSIGTLAGIGLAVGSSLRSRRLELRHLSWIGIAVLTCMTIPVNVPRYLLPAIDHGVLWMAAELAAWARDARGRWAASLAFALTLALAGTMGISTLVHVSYTPQIALDARGEHEAFEELVATLEARGVHHVFATRPFLPWRLMFRTHEQILARSLEAKDRDPRSLIAVDRAQAEGRPTALVALAPERARIESLLGPGAEIIDVRGRYLIVIQPDDALLADLSFAR